MPIRAITIMNINMRVMPEEDLQRAREIVLCGQPTKVVLKLHNKNKGWMIRSL